MTIKPIIVFMSAFRDNLGGTERWTNAMAVSLRNRGFQVKWISLFPSPHPFTFQRPDDIETSTLYTRYPGKFWPAYALPPVRKLRAYLKSLPAGSVLICTDSWMMRHINLAGALVGPDTSLTLIGQHHFQFPTLKRKAKRLRRVFRRADVLLFLTQEDAEKAIRNGLERVEFIPNPAPVAHPEIGEFPKKKLFVALGRLAPQKSYEYAIQAWALAGPSLDEWKLLIYGDGPQEEMLADLIDEKGLGGRVVLKGPTSNPLEILAGAEVHVSTSQSEGFPLNILEASTMGTPTIAFDCAPGVRAQIKDGDSGRLVEMNDVDALAAAFVELAEDAPLRERMGRSAALESRKYDIEQITDIWISLIERVQHS